MRYVIIEGYKTLTVRTWLTKLMILLLVASCDFAAVSSKKHPQSAMPDSTASRSVLSLESDSLLFFLAKFHSKNKLITWDADSSILNISLEKSVRENIFYKKTVGADADTLYLGTKYEWLKTPLVVLIFFPDSLRLGRLVTWHQIAKEKNECVSDQNPAIVFITGNTIGLKDTAQEEPLPVLCAIAEGVSNPKEFLSRSRPVRWEIIIDGEKRNGKGMDVNGDLEMDIFWDWKSVSESEKSSTIFRRKSGRWQKVWSGIYKECI